MQQRRSEPSKDLVSRWAPEWSGPDLAGESQREPKWVKESRNEWEWQWQSEPERARVSKSKPKWARESLAHKYLAHRLAHKKSHLCAVSQKKRADTAVYCEQTSFITSNWNLSNCTYILSENHETSQLVLLPVDIHATSSVGWWSQKIEYDGFIKTP